MAIIQRDVYQISVDTKNSASSLAALVKVGHDLRVELGAVGTSLDGMATDLKGVERAAKGTEDHVKTLRTRFIELDSVVSLASRAVGGFQKALGLLAQPIGLATQFEKELALVDTITNRAGTRFADQFLAISESTGREAAEVARSAYQAVSASIAEEDVAGFIGIADELARAGNAALTPTISLLATIRTQYKLTTEEVRGASAVLFDTTRLGVTKIEELATELGAAIPLAKQAGFSLREVAASMAAITKGGISTSEAATQVRATAVAFIKNGAAMAKALTGAGFAIEEADFKALSFIEKTRLLNRAFGDQGDVLLKLFGRIEGATAVLALGANNAAHFQEALESNANAADGYSAAVQRMGETAEFAQRKMKATFQRQLIQLGQDIMPAVNDALSELVKLTRENGSEIAGMVRALVGGFVEFGKFVVENAAPIKAFFAAVIAQSLIKRAIGMGIALKGMAAGVAGVGTAAKGASVGVAALAGPVGLLVASMPLLTAGATALGAALGEVANSSAYATQEIMKMQLVAQEQQLKKSLAGLSSVAELTARRGGIVAGDLVILSPEAIEEVKGVISAGAAESAISLKDAFASGMEQAEIAVNLTLNKLGDSAETQVRIAEDAQARLESLSAELALADEEYAKYVTYVGATITKQSDDARIRVEMIEEEAEILHNEVDTARRRAATLEIARANLSAKFQTEMLQRLKDALTGVGSTAGSAVSGFASGIGSLLGAGAPPAKPKTPRRGGSRRAKPKFEAVDQGILDSYRKELDEEARLRAAANALNASNRLASIEDTTVRELALLSAKHDAEVEAARSIGADISLVRSRQALELNEHLALLAEDRAAYELGRADLHLRSIIDADERAVEALASRHEAELEAAEAQGYALIELRAAQEYEMTSIVARQAHARRDAQIGSAEAVVGAIHAINGALAAAGVQSDFLAGVAIFGEGLVLQAKAATWALDAVAAGATGNYAKSVALGAAAVGAQAQALVDFAKAAGLGAGGGGGGGAQSLPTASGSGAGSSRTDSDRPLSLGDDGRGGSAGGVTIVLGTTFNGPVYDTEEAARRAVARNVLHGFQDLSADPRGIPRVDFGRLGRT